MDEVTSRYRKIEVRTWSDDKFRRLSAIPPCGQGLWLYLLTGPHTTSLPGLSRIGRAAMAEDLGWEQEAFDKAFQEAFQEGMVKGDWKARVVWVPNAAKYNKPQSPNVVTGWGKEFDLIPDCDLKWEARTSLEASVHALGESYAKAFDKAFAKPFSKPLPKTMPNQEQEQEQEQEKRKDTRVPRSDGDSSSEQRSGEGQGADQDGSGEGTKPRKKRKVSPPAESISIPGWLDPSAWQAFLDHRKFLKSPMSEQAQALAVAHLKKIMEAGTDPAEVINRSILNGWKGFYPEKKIHNGSSARRPAPDNFENRNYGSGGVL